jgi:hypothetical protein
MPLRKQKIILAIVTLSAALFLSTAPLVSQAAGLVPCGGPTEKPCTVLDVFTIIARVTNWLVAMAGIYAVYQFINHGFWLVISMGNEEAITKHRSGLMEAVLGFILVMIAFMLINTVVNFIFLGTAPQGSHLDLTSPCTYLNASASCVNGN